MKYYLITGRTPAQEYVPAREYQPAREFQPPEYGEDDQGNKYLKRNAIPAHPEVPAAAEKPAVPAEDIKIMIGETNPFQTNGKPFKPQFHQDFGITTVDAWKRLIIVYGSRIIHEYIVTPLGLVQEQNRNEVIPAAHLFALLNDGFVKEGKTEGSVEKVIYWKQKGRIEDDMGKTYTAEEMIKILEDK